MRRKDEVERQTVAEVSIESHKHWQHISTFTKASINSRLPKALSVQIFPADGINSISSHSSFNSSHLRYLCASLSLARGFLAKPPKMWSFTVSAEMPASAQKIWMAMKDAPVIIPKIAPHAVASIDHVDDSPKGVGAVRLTNLVAPPGAWSSFVKEKLVAIDHASMSATTEEVEGGHLDQGFSKWVSTVKFTAISDSSCMWETVIDYEGGNEAAIAMAKQQMPKMMATMCEYVNKQ